MDYLTVLVFTLVVITILSCYLCMKAPHTPVKHTLAIVIFGTGIWMISMRVLVWPMLRELNLFPPPFWVVPTIHTLGWLLGGVWLWFAATYPVQRRWAQYSALSLILLTLGASWAGWWWLGIPPITQRSPYAEQDWRFPVMVCWLILCSGGSLIYLSIHAMRVRGLARLRAKHMVVGSTSLVVGMIFDLFLRNKYIYTPHPLIGLFLLIGGAITLTYVCSVVRLNTVKRYIRTVMILSMSLALFFLLIRYCANPLKEFLEEYIFNGDSGMGMLSATALLGLSFPLLCLGIRFITEHLLFTPPYSITKVMEQLSNALNTVRSRSAVAQVVATNIRSLFSPMLLSLYSSEANGNSQCLFHESTNESSRILTDEHPLFHKVSQLTDPLVTDELLDKDAHHEFGKELSSLGIHLVVPFHTTGRLIGMLCLGEKLSGDAYSREDIRLLGALSNAIALALDNAYHYEALMSLNQELETRVMERTEQLEAQAEQLRAADQAKDRFLATVSHELLTPLTAILGWAELGTLARTEERQQRAFETIYESGLRQKRLVNDLLDVSRLIYEKFELQVAPADLWQITSSAVTDFQAQFNERQLTVLLDAPVDGLTVLVDRIRIHQVLSNLISNAIKFTNPGGTIRISAQRTTTHCILTIQDTGKGIATEDLNRIFDIFEQGQQQGFSKGLGLGLALVKGIVTLHYGDVTASSPGLGHGSTFTIMLPLYQSQSEESVSACDPENMSWEREYV